MFRRDLRRHLSFVAALPIGDHIPNVGERRLTAPVALLVTAGSVEPQPVTNDPSAVRSRDVMADLVRRIGLRREIRFM